MRHGWLIALALLAACEDGTGTTAATTALVAPDRLVFPRTFVGHPTSVDLTLTNGGQTPLAVTIDVPAPFRTDAAVDLPAGATRALRVTFDPPAPGPHDAVLHLRAGTIARDVQLVASAEEPADCRPSTSCRTSRFDPSTGICVETNLADGTGCEGACLVDARCVSGECLGRSRDCDDGNVCTFDACDAAKGCVHDASRPDCPAPSEPCKVPVCDPSTGCGVADAPDGTPCGAFSCEEAHLCFFGRCVSLAPPDGIPCLPQGGCMGECRSRACVETVATPSVAWTYTPPPLRELHFSGLVDGAGNHYWLEYNGPWQAELVSVARDGAERFRSRLDVLERHWAGAPRVAVLAGDLVVVAASANRIEARRTSDGSLAWTRNLFDALAPERPTRFGDTIPAVRVNEIVVLPSGELALKVGYVADFSCGDDCWSLDPGWDWVVLMSRAGGIRWTRRAGWREDVARFTSLLGTSDGGLAYGSLDRLFFRTTAENELLATSFSGDAPLAADGSWLVRKPARRTDVLFIAPLQALGPAQDRTIPALAPVVLAEGKAYGVTTEPGPRLKRIDLATASEDWSLPLDARAPVVTNHGTILFIAGEPAAARFVELNVADGRPRAACVLPAGKYEDRRASLHDGRWVVPAVVVDPRTGEPVRIVRAFDFDGLDVASRGWVCEDGSMSRDRRPR